MKILVSLAALLFASLLVLAATSAWLPAGALPAAQPGSSYGSYNLSANQSTTALGGAQVAGHLTVDNKGPGSVTVQVTDSQGNRYTSIQVSGQNSGGVGVPHGGTVTISTGSQGAKGKWTFVPTPVVGG